MVSNAILQFHAGWDFLILPDGVEVSSAISGTRLKISGIPERLKRLMQALDAGVQADEACSQLASTAGISEEAVYRLLEQLRIRGAIAVQDPTILGDQPVLYDRQVRFFDHFASNTLSGVDFDRRLRQSRVLVVGVGGYGTWLTLLCSRVGIREIVALDPDVIELSNLNRQILYEKADVGQPKIRVASRRLTAADPDIKFEGYPVWIRCAEDLLPYLDGVHLAFDTFGYLPNPTHHALMEACATKGTPFLTMGGSWVGPLCIPGLWLVALKSA